MPGVLPMAPTRASQSNERKGCAPIIVANTSTEGPVGSSDCLAPGSSDDKGHSDDREIRSNWPALEPL